MAAIAQTEDILIHAPQNSEQRQIQSPGSELKIEMGENIEPKEPETFRHSWDIMAVFFALLLLSLMSSIDATIVTTALPTIAREFGSGQDYICRLTLLNLRPKAYH